MAILQMENVSWTRHGKQILHEINWSIQSGEHWVILGLNGSGKTSLLDIMNGYHFPSRGRVEVLGNPFGKTDMLSLRKQIGWVSRAMALRFETDRPMDTVLEVVVSGKFGSTGVWNPIERNDELRARQILVDVQSDELCDKRFSVLSQGERQSALIARALMANPQLLILDEPCTGLDIKSRERLLRMLPIVTSRPDSPTVIYVTHHVEEILPFMTHVMVLDNGRVVAQGSKQEVMKEDVLSRAFHIPIHVAEAANGRYWIQVAT